MPRRVVRALRLEDGYELTDNYHRLRSILYDKNFEVNRSDLYCLKEKELVYLYWELVHTRVYSPKVKENIKLYREYLIDEFMNRKYKRGRYKNG